MTEKKQKRVTRDAALFVFGVGGIIHETVFNLSLERPYLLLLFAYMIGLPVVSPLLSKFQGLTNDQTSSHSKAVETNG